MQPDLQRMQQLTEDVLERLARPLFPGGLKSGAPRLMVISTGLLARITDLSESALVLSARDRQGDLGILVRCLFEHVVMLAWLTGGTPEQSHERMLLWQRYDDEQRRKIDREVTALQGKGMLSDEVRAELDASIHETEEAGLGQMPGLADRALVADREWEGRIAIPFRETYSKIYRTMSVSVHPTQAALNLVTARLHERTVLHLEETGTGAATLGAVPALLMVALTVSAYSFGRPTLDDVEAGLDRLVDALDLPP